MATRRTAWAGAAAVALGMVAGAGAPAWGGEENVPADEGRALFLREWVPGEARPSGGDGLGPAFNDTSCVACHNAGGPGGGGPSSKNVDILSAVPMPGMQQGGGMVEVPPSAPPPPGFLARSMQALFGVEPVAERAATIAPGVPAPRARLDRGPLVALHPGFRSANSVVLHRFATDPEYEGRRTGALGMGFMGGGPGGGQAALMQARMLAANEASTNVSQTQAGPFFVLRSQRNPTALFGAGALDSVPESVLVAQAARRHDGFPEIAGRVARGKDGRAGRFGWKGQTPTLDDFVRTACAVELGLEVPGHAQGALPGVEVKPAPGLDLTDEECRALTEYVRALPTPGLANADHPDVVAGRSRFEAIGCATCHAPDLGPVQGVYSDLLLHDMGQDLGDVGQYGVFDGSSEPEPEPDPAASGPIVQQAAPPAGGSVSTVLSIGPLPALPAGAAAGATIPTIATFVDGASTTNVVVVGTPTGSEAAPIAPPIAVPDLSPEQVAFVEQQAVPFASTAPVTTTTTTVQVVSGGGMMMAPATPFGVSPTRPKDGPASRQEWRTPPLWGLRDSGPYLHDGRAKTLEQAIALHGGEAQRSAQMFFDLPPTERVQVEAFLRALVAPPVEALVAR